MPPMKMKHGSDPRQHLWNRVGDLSEWKVFHNYILVALYIRPDQTDGGILLPDATIDEDKYQGKVGMVVKKGPMAFLSEGNANFHGQDVELGEWVALRPSDGWPCYVNGCECRVVRDVDFKMAPPKPDRVW